jgi:quercetin dioxygenase-like cupin family protein
VGLHLIPGGDLGTAAGLSASSHPWLRDALAELTHAPTGFSGLDAVTHTVNPGATSPPRSHGGNSALICVLEGELQASSLDEPARWLRASAGDTLAVDPRTSYMLSAVAATPSRYLLFLPLAGSPSC